MNVQLMKPVSSPEPGAPEAPEILQRLVQQAEQAGASDIHLQMRGATAEITFRLDGVLARARDIEVPEGGFVRFRDRWVTPAEKESVLLLERIDRLFERLDAAEGKSREGVVGEIRGLPEEARETLVGALLRRREKVVERLAASPATRRR